jgi:hypothetical protein
MWLLAQCISHHIGFFRMVMDFQVIILDQLKSSPLPQI